MPCSSSGIRRQYILLVACHSQIDCSLSEPDVMVDFPSLTICRAFAFNDSSHSALMSALSCVCIMFPLFNLKSAHPIDYHVLAEWLSLPQQRADISHGASNCHCGCNRVANASRRCCSDVSRRLVQSCHCSACLISRSSLARICESDCRSATGIAFGSFTSFLSF